MITDLTFTEDDLGGLDLIRRMALKDAATPILVLSMHDAPFFNARALKNGARGYALKDSPSGQLMAAIRKLLAGEDYLDHDLAIRIAMHRSRQQTSMASLTEREAQILSLLGKGHPNQRIAAKLGISAKTVSNATALMRTKLHLASLADLIAYAMRWEV